MPWTIQREDIVGPVLYDSEKPSVTPFDLGSPQNTSAIEFFPAQISNPANPEQPIQIRELVARYTSNQPNETSHTKCNIDVYMQLVCINTDPSALIQKVAFVYLKVPHRVECPSILPTRPRLQLHYPSYTYSEEITFKKRVEKLALSDLCAFHEFRFQKNAVSYSECHPHLYSSEQLEPLTTLLETYQIPQAIIKLIKGHTKLTSPQEQDFYERVSALSDETIVEAFDDLKKTAIDIRQHLSFQVAVHDNQMFLNDQSLYRLAERCRELGQMDLAQNALWELLTRLISPKFRDSKYIMRYISCSEKRALQDFFDIILWDTRLPGKVLSSGAIERLLKLANLPNASVSHELEKALVSILPIYLEIAGFPLNHRPEGVNIDQNPDCYENRILDKFLYMLNALTLSCQEKDAQLRVLQHREPLMFTEPRNTRSLQTKPAAPRRSVSFS